MFSAKVLNIGFLVALVITVILMGSSVSYLFFFMSRLSALPELPPPPTVLPESGGQFLTDAYLVTRYQQQAQLQREMRSEMSQLIFNSCALFVGIALAFIGLALFMMGIRGEMDASGESQKVSVKFARLSPGMLAMICATLIVIWCVNSRSSSDTAQTTAPPASSHHDPRLQNDPFAARAAGAPGGGTPSIPGGASALLSAATAAAQERSPSHGAAIDPSTRDKQLKDVLAVLEKVTERQVAADSQLKDLLAEKDLLRRELELKNEQLRRLDRALVPGKGPLPPS